MAKAETLDQRVAQLAPHFLISRPAGDGPFPVVVMLHGCGGMRPFMEEMRRVVVDAGAVALQVDSYTHRRISRVEAIATVCTGAQLMGRERAGDLYAAMEWVRRQSWAAGDRIGAIGWSHGAWTVMDALALRAGSEMQRATGLSDLSDEPLAGLQKTLLVYPYASVGSLTGHRPWRMAPPSTAILCGRDFIVGIPRGPLERQRALGSPLEIVMFADCTHAFEDRFAEDPRVRYNPDATAREHRMISEMVSSL